MPPKKRTLAEADSSAANGPSQAAKRSTRTAKSTGKENSKQTATASSSSSSASASKAAADRQTGDKPSSRKSKAKTPPESSNGKAAATPTSAAPKQAGRRGSKKQSAAGSSAKGDATVDQAPLAKKPDRPILESDYIVLNRPEEETNGADDDDHKDIIAKNAADYPDWKWVITQKAEKTVAKWMTEFRKRDQDMLGLAIYNDFSGYGEQEVIENILVEFHKDYSKVDADVHNLWDHIQTLAFCFKLAVTPRWYNIDDGERVSATLHVIGTGILSMLNALERKELLKADSSVRNIALVMSLCLHIASTNPEAIEVDLIGRRKTQLWPSQIVGYLRHHNIEISDKTGVVGTQAYVQSLPVIRYEDFERKTGKSAVDRWGFKIMWNAFHTRWAKKEGRGPKRLGGESYDLTKWSKQDRIKYSFNGVDPMEKIGSIFE